jgi:hypothetical protein
VIAQILIGAVLVLVVMVALRARSSDKNKD